MVKVWDRKPQTHEELEARRKEIKEQRIIFELEMQLEEELVAFRDLKLKWMDERVTLDEILNDDSWSICKKISKLRGERNARAPVR